jgi:hypothetical protein
VSSSYRLVAHCTQPLSFAHVLHCHSLYSTRAALLCYALRKEHCLCTHASKTSAEKPKMYLGNWEGCTLCVLVCRSSGSCKGKVSAVARHALCMLHCHEWLNRRVAVFLCECIVSSCPERCIVMCSMSSCRSRTQCTRNIMSIDVGAHKNIRVVRA